MFVEPVYCRIVTSFGANQQVGVLLYRHLTQDLDQVLQTELAGSTSTMGELS